MKRGQGTAKRKREDATLKITLPARLGPKQIPDLDDSDLAAEIAAEIAADPFGDDSPLVDDDATPPPVLLLSEIPPPKKPRTHGNTIGRVFE